MRARTPGAFAVFASRCVLGDTCHRACRAADAGPLRHVTNKTCIHIVCVHAHIRSEGLTHPGLEQDYHFMPCVACISLWSGKRLESPAFPEKQAPPPPPEPPRSPTSKVAAQTELPPPEEEEKPKKREVENKYNPEARVRLILGAREGGVRIFESSTRVRAPACFLR